MSHTRWKTARSADVGVSPEYEAIYEETRDADDLAQMVYDRRTELGLSEGQLAERAGMTEAQISRIEGGGTAPTLPLLVRLAFALGWPRGREMDILYGRSGSPPETHLSEALPRWALTDPHIQIIWEFDLPVEVRIDLIRILVEAELQRIQQGQDGRHSA